MIGYLVGFLMLWLVWQVIAWFIRTAAFRILLLITIVFFAVLFIVSTTPPPPPTPEEKKRREQEEYCRQKHRHKWKEDTNYRTFDSSILNSNDIAEYTRTTYVHETIFCPICNRYIKNEERSYKENISHWDYMHGGDSK